MFHRLLYCSTNQIFSCFLNIKNKFYFFILHSCKNDFIVSLIPLTPTIYFFVTDIWHFFDFQFFLLTVRGFLMNNFCLFYSAKLKPHKLDTFWNLLISLTYRFWDIKYLILIFSTVRLSVLKILSPKTFFAQKIINKF